MTGPDEKSEGSETDGGEVSEAQGAAGTVSDGDAPTGDPDLADAEQPDPATEPELSDDQVEG
jgi:hypothetical protein